MFTDRCGSSRGFQREELPATFHAETSLQEEKDNEGIVKGEPVHSTLARVDGGAAMGAAGPAPTIASAHLSGARLVEARYNATLANLITKAYVNDFVKFQYAMWDGASAFQDRQF